MLKEIRNFAHFEYLLCQRLGFKKITPDEFKERLRQLGKRPPRPREGKETGFQLDRGELMLKVWTSYLEDEEKLRERGTDSGWVLIVQNGKTAYFSHQIFRRSEKFLLNLYKWVWINWCRVSNRPSCPECNEYMEITPGPHLKQRYWACKRRKLHQTKKKYSLDFNFALPPEAKRWLRGVYKQRKKYNTQVKEAGKQLYAAMLKRKKWIPRPK